MAATAAAAAAAVSSSGSQLSNSRFRAFYDVIHLDSSNTSAAKKKKQQQMASNNDKPRRLLHSTTSVGSNSTTGAPTVSPCEKHPPEYFAQLLEEKQQQKAKLNQLWPKHWGCKIFLKKYFFFLVSV